ncbi:MAG: hypothetical protein IJE51_01205 [Clostridia bacterium]|nr:hypothetical protein [Clostridia bacterium]
MFDLGKDAPIYGALASYARSKQASFHTPGHKNYRFSGDFFGIYPFDATEISCTDELYSPEGCIAEAEAKATELFGSYHTFFSAGGASQCVKAALAEFAGEKVIFDRNIHFSAAAAVAFYGIDTVFVCGKNDEKTSLPMPPTAEDIRSAIEKDPDAKAVFLTSPNYFGISADCLAIRKLCDEKNTTFIDDNSHGTHYCFCPEMKNSPYDGHHAHVVIDSAHKTLPVMTGGAFLHYNKEISLETVRRRMMAAGSTSPSFPILASLDHGRAVCSCDGEKTYSVCCEKIKDLKKKLVLNGFTVADGTNTDPLRLAVYFGEKCEDTAKKLEKNNIYPEMTSSGFIVFIITPFNSNEDLELLEKTLLSFEAVEIVENFNSGFELPPKKMNIRDAFFAEREAVEPLISEGRISAEMISFHHPPCVPLALPGEVISHDLALFMRENGYGKVEVVVKNDIELRRK